MFAQFAKITGRLGFAALLAHGPLAAQDLDVDVVRDEANDLAIYTATVTAPPGSSYWLFASPFTLANPLNIPGFVNTLDLDPAFLLRLSGPVPVGPTGTGSFTFSLTMSPLENIEIPFQALVVDPARTLAFSSLATAVHGAESNDFGPQWVGGYSRRTGVYKMHFFGAAPGDRIEIKINGGQKGIAQGVVGPNGTLNLRLNVQLHRGDGVTICRNGQPVKSWSFC